MDASIIIRTYNEERYLGELLAAINGQEAASTGTDGSAFEIEHEVLVVDSGSTDRTREIAESFGARILHITPEDFSFGRSLNVGCDAARGKVLVFISGHCVPCDAAWLRHLVTPIFDGRVVAAYGKQRGGEETKLSEHQVFAKLFPEQSAIPQEGFFCNNANAAVQRAVWEGLRFDEELLGLEDMFLGRQLVEAGMRLGYVAEAAVYHYHHETWAQVRRRYEREAIALQRVRPEWHLTFFEFLRYFTASVLLDTSYALQEKRWLRSAGEIFLFRFMQYWGSYRGNHEHRQMAKREKKRYFYPK